MFVTIAFQVWKSSNLTHGGTGQTDDVSEVSSSSKDSGFLNSTLNIDISGGLFFKAVTVEQLSPVRRGCCNRTGR